MFLAVNYFPVMTNAGIWGIAMQDSRTYLIELLAQLTDEEINNFIDFFLSLPPLQ